MITLSYFQDCCEPRSYNLCCIRTTPMICGTSGVSPNPGPGRKPTGRASDCSNCRSPENCNIVSKSEPWMEGCQKSEILIFTLFSERFLISMIVYSKPRITFSCCYVSVSIQLLLSPRTMLRRVYSNAAVVPCVGASVRPCMDLVNTIETTPLSVFSSNLADMLTMIRGWTLLILKVGGHRSRSH